MSFSAFMYTLPRHISGDFSIHLSFKYFSYIFKWFYIRFWCVSKANSIKLSDFSLLCKALSYARLNPHDPDLTPRIKSVCTVIPYGLNTLINLLPLGGKISFLGGININFKIAASILLQITEAVTINTNLHDARYNIEQALIHNRIKMVELDIFVPTSKNFYLNSFFAFSKSAYPNQHPEQTVSLMKAPEPHIACSDIIDSEESDFRFLYLHTIAYVPDLTFSICVTILFGLNIASNIVETVAVHIGCKYVHCINIDSHMPGLIDAALEFIFKDLFAEVHFGSSKSFGSTPGSKSSGSTSGSKQGKGYKQGASSKQGSAQAQPGSTAGQQTNGKPSEKADSDGTSTTLSKFSIEILNKMNNLISKFEILLNNAKHGPILT